MGEEVFRDVRPKEGLVDPLPEVVVVLDLLDDYQAVVLRLEEVVVLIVDEVIHCARVLPILLLLGGVTVERVCAVLSSLVFHEGLREEGLVVSLDLVDQVFHFSLEFEFLLFLGVQHRLIPFHVSLRSLSDIECIPILGKLLRWLSHALGKKARRLLLTLMGS